MIDTTIQEESSTQHVTGDAAEFQSEVRSGQRFEFGQNWSRFLSVLDEGRITQADLSLQQMLEMRRLEGQSFLDVGCGSGLFSLAAMRLGATRVHSLDYDPHSVACAHELKTRYFPQTEHWTIERGSALDVAYIKSLEQWDIVYSWGVLHHTGDMWSALGNVALLVKTGGRLFISIYNDQGGQSMRWKKIKILFNKGLIGRWLITGIIIPYWVLRGLAIDILKRKNPISHYTGYKKQRGMSVTHDWFDWLGGYPFEVAKPEQIFNFYSKHGFILERLKTCGGGLGCNEFVFKKR